MAVSQISIVNDALAHLGEPPTETLDANLVRPAARKVLAFLEKARDLVLSAQDWLDARAYATLQPAVLGPGASASFAYTDAFWAPDLFLMARDVRPAGDALSCGAGGLKWERGGEPDLSDPSAPTWRTVLRANTGGAAVNLVFTRRIDWSVIPVYLDVPMGYQLAALACFDVTGTGERQAGLVQATAVAIGSALGKDAIQTGGQDPLLPDVYGALRRSAG